MNYLTATAITTKRANAIVRYFERTNWEKITDTLIDRGIQLIFLTLIFLLIRRLGKFLIHRAFEHYRQRVDAGGRVDTMGALTQNTFVYVVGFFYAYSFLTIIGIPVGTLIAGAGIVGLAVGFGAQGFVSDLVNGFFIIMEGQLDVGDSVQIGDIAGTVTAVGLRTTKITSADGTLNFIPNRSITIVRNLSRNAMNITVSIPLAGGGHTAEIEQILTQVNKELGPNSTELTAAPQLLGLSQNSWGGFVYQVLLTTTPGNQLAAQRQFLAAYVDALTKAGIQLRTAPTPQAPGK
ncbi:mechanosensitive ion channel family protein [Lacticaseibacillus hulanensis]|uniref:mechanosensitive ion channel family protein n=1 Tax=Lacticaseibacillus hulanensis TaxID=2493111 RepID=UPI000FD8443A|nr:mechanosensitive ion channel domain-containing protein [Lacticaseibacillus hulanensis]